VLWRAERVLIAGQREFEIRDDRIANGIPLHPSIVTLLNRLAEEVGVPLPEPL
jgi:LDH2 family malate/lactate/ureidoglycolate dehydrogenase